MCSIHATHILTQTLLITLRLLTRLVELLRCFLVYVLSQHTVPPCNRSVSSAVTQLQVLLIPDAFSSCTHISGTSFQYIIQYLQACKSSFTLQASVSHCEQQARSCVHQSIIPFAPSSHFYLVSLFLCRQDLLFPQPLIDALQLGSCLPLVTLRVTS